MTHSELADKTIKEWGDAVAKDPRLNRAKESLIKHSLWDGTFVKSWDTELRAEKNRVEISIKTLTGQNLINGDSIVLDLGCGTGAFALPLAKIVNRVDAVDIAKPMTDFLSEKIAKENVKNIRVIQKDWKDLAGEYPGEKYDLVLSSLNPDMYNGGAILKMTELSRRACLFSSPYKRGESNIMRKLDELVLGPMQKPEVDCRAIIYPFNILYYLGYNPQLEYVEDSWTIRESADEAVKRLTVIYEAFMDVNDTVKNKIKDFVYARQKGGIFEQNTVGHIGLLIWKVKGENING